MRSRFGVGLLAGITATWSGLMVFFPISLGLMIFGPSEGKGPRMDHLAIQLVLAVFGVWLVSGITRTIIFSAAAQAGVSASAPALLGALGAGGGFAAAVLLETTIGLVAIGGFAAAFLGTFLVDPGERRTPTAEQRPSAAARGARPRHPPETRGPSGCS
jgi:hypothetical protein